MPKTKVKKIKLSKRITRLWIPTALTMAVFTVLIWSITESYNRQVLGDNVNLPRATALLSGFIPTKKVESTHKAFEYFKKAVSDKKGNYSIYMQDLATGTDYSYNPMQMFYAASLYKIPVAVSAFMYLQDTGKTLDDKVMLKSSDFSSGTGVLTKYPSGTMLTYREIFETLVKESDNTAQSLLLRTTPQNYLNKGFNLNNDFSWNSNFMAENITTSYNYAHYMAKVYQGEYLTNSNKDLIFKAMEHTSFDDRLTPHFKEGAVFSHKIGSWGDTQNWHDCGILKYGNKEFSVCVMSNNAQFNIFQEVSAATAEFINNLVI